MIDKQKIAQLDKQKVYESIEFLPKQIQQVIDDSKNFNFDNTYKDVESITISGMGGSIYNYYVISSLFNDSLLRPVTMLNGYNFPAYINKKTLFIGSSYSGSTEETISTTEHAIKEGITTTVVTAGGKLGELAKNNNLNYYEFDPKYNPCGQPRVGLGYTIFGPILLLNSLGVLKIDMTVLTNALKVLDERNEEMQEYAGSFISDLKNKTIIYIASEHLSSNAHISRNQMNETAKAFAEYHLIPELNHHLLEGLTYPKNNNLMFLFFNSPYYFARNTKRFAVTKDVLEKQNCVFKNVQIKASNRLEEFLLYLQFGSYISFFMGIENGLDPSLIPWVDYFKKELAG